MQGCKITVLLSSSFKSAIVRCDNDPTSVLIEQFEDFEELSILEEKADIEFDDESVIEDV